MSLKILVVPFLIVMMLVLGIGYIQPDWQLIQEKKSILAIKEKQTADMQTIIGNIETLYNSLASQKESEQFVKRYIPESKDQGRVIDAINFSASQSGLLVESMKVEEPQKSAYVEEPIVSADMVGVSGTSALGGSDPNAAMQSIPAYQAPLPRAYTIEVSTRGTYENIKAFLDRVARMDRFQEFQSFGVMADEQSATEGDPAAMLIGTVRVKFGYLLMQPVESALNIPVFQQSKLDFSTVGRALNRATNSIPVLEKPESGRPNPFH